MNSVSEFVEFEVYMVWSQTHRQLNYMSSVHANLGQQEEFVNIQLMDNS